MQAMSLANGPTRQTDWQGVNWRAANRSVRNLRQRIFGRARRATSSGSARYRSSCCGATPTRSSAYGG
jgi:hypothetical protein